ncbi:MAG TPA: LLM class flavin-dependent oxidoreductase [Saprospiraceae bacterium]|nr:LLM class flavin-dependent oxidoreductase [Saprospiraceae bacterium]HMQ85620.1 LLM class flavin-dependent oxidoreductase [Saprospiraceae bacterium]
MTQIGLLDIGVKNKTNDHEYLNEVLKIVKKAEDLGFTRYWLGEHYSPSLAWWNPELLIGILAGITDEIKIGIAGTLINMHAPTRVAQNFKLLNYFFNGRIDMGIAKGIPKNSTLLEVLSDHPITIDNFINKATSLIDFLRESTNAAISKHNIIIPPRGVPPPEIWILGSSTNSLPLVLELNVHFCLSLFHNLDHQYLPEKMQQFKEQYFERYNAFPKVSISVLGFCAETNTKAQHLKESYGIKGFYPNIIGTPQECEEQLINLQHKFQVDEIIYLDICPFEERMFTLMALHEFFSLSQGIK